MSTENTPLDRIVKHTSSGGYGSPDTPKARRALLTKIKDSCLLAQGLCWAGFFFECIMLCASLTGFIGFLSTDGAGRSMIGVPGTTYAVSKDYVLTLYGEDGGAATFYGEQANDLRGSQAYEDGQTVSTEKLYELVNLLQQRDFDPAYDHEKQGDIATRTPLEMLYVTYGRTLPIEAIIANFVATPILLAMLWVGARFFRRSAREEGPLRPARAFELRLVAFLLIAYAILPGVIGNVAVPAGIRVLGGYSSMIVSTTPLALGVFMLAFARVFKYGSMLQQQDDELV